MVNPQYQLFIFSPKCVAKCSLLCCTDHLSISAVGPVMSSFDFMLRRFLFIYVASLFGNRQLPQYFYGY